MIALYLEEDWNYTCNDIFTVIQRKSKEREKEIYTYIYICIEQSRETREVEKSRQHKECINASKRSERGDKKDEVGRRSRKRVRY